MGQWQHGYEGEERKENQWIVQWMLKLKINQFSSGLINKTVFSIMNQFEPFAYMHILIQQIHNPWGYLLTYGIQPHYSKDLWTHPNIMAHWLDLSKQSCHNKKSVDRADIMPNVDSYFLRVAVNKYQLSYHLYYLTFFVIPNLAPFTINSRSSIW